ncbi:MAG TPA: insulinase family protein [Sphingomonas sp.]
MKFLQMLRSASPIALMLAALPAAAQDAPAPVPVAELVKRVDIPYETFTLANGLRVIVHTDRKAPIVAVSTWYDVGSKHEPKGKTGFAHLFEHLMFNGSENAPGDFYGYLRSIGGTDYNGTTNTDRTNYFQTVPAPALDRTLFLESDRMGWLLGAIDQKVLDEQRGVVQNEKRQRDNQPYGLVYYKLFEELLAGTPYGHLPIGSMADLDAASLEDVKNWFRAHYGPNNAVLVLAGDVDAQTARPLVEKHFGKIAAGPRSALPKVVMPVLAESKTVTLKDRVAATMIMRAWVVPGMNDKEAVALDAVADVLGGLASSRLDNALVRKEKLAVSVSAGVQSMSQIGIFTMQMTLKPGADPGAATRRAEEILAELIAKGPTADEVRRVATTNVADRIAGLESVGGFGGKAVALASGQLYSGDPLFFKKQLQATARITPAAVRAAAARWLTRPSLTIRVEPGVREAYQDTQGAPAAANPEAAQATSVKGTRGGLPDVPQIGELDFPKVSRARLSNGVEVIYARRGAVPITQIVLSFDAGVSADPDGKLGTQGLTLSMLDEGTTSRDSTAIAEARERLGADIGAGSSADRTYLTLATPSPNLAASLNLFADVVRNPAFAPEEVERLRASMLAGIAQSLTSPGGLGNRVLPKLLYGPASPYAKLAAGSGDPAAVKALTRDDLVAFHRAWIRPDKAKIFVVSDAPLAEVQAALEARFGNWKGEGAAGTKSFATAPAQSQPRIVLVDRPDSPQSLILAGQMTGLDPQSELLTALTANEILGGNFLSRINTDLRETKHWSYGVSGGFGWLEHAVPYTISAPVQADKTGASVEALMLQVREFLSTRGITDAELRRAIDGNVRELAGRFETAAAVLSAMQTNDLRGRPDDFYASIAQKYRGMTAAQLDAAARAALNPDRFVWVIVGDATKVRPQLDSLGLPVEVIPAAAVVAK